jgi:hypothetical protein
MVILADNKKFHSSGNHATLKTELNEIVTFIKFILEQYRDCLIITHNKVDAEILKKELERQSINPCCVTYYNSSDTIGVECTSRVAIVIGMPTKPANTFDSRTFDKDKSKIMLHENIQVDALQAWSRIKCPDGKDFSLVFALKCTYNDCISATTWGIDREIDIDTSVVCSEYLPDIEVIPCTSTNDMINQACKYRPMKLNDSSIEGTHTSYKKPKKIKPKYKEFDPTENIITHQKIIKNPIELMLKVNPRPFKHLIKDEHNKWHSPTYNNKLTSERANTHYKGENTLGFYLLSKENTVESIFFGIKNNNKAEINKNKLCGYLTSWSVPYVLEKLQNNEYLYRVWILLDAAPAKIARIYGVSILKQTDIDADLYPENNFIVNNNLGRNGEYAELPLSINSSILINDEFTRSFTNFKTKLVDLSKFKQQSVAAKNV